MTGTWLFALASSSAPVAAIYLVAFIAAARSSCRCWAGMASSPASRWVQQVPFRASPSIFSISLPGTACSAPAPGWASYWRRSP